MKSLEHLSLHAAMYVPFGTFLYPLPWDVDPPVAFPSLRSFFLANCVVSEDLTLFLVRQSRVLSHVALQNCMVNRPHNQPPTSTFSWAKLFNTLQGCNLSALTSFVIEYDDTSLSSLCMYIHPQSSYSLSIDYQSRVNSIQRSLKDGIKLERFAYASDRLRLGDMGEIRAYNDGHLPPLNLRAEDESAYEHLQEFVKSNARRIKTEQRNGI